MSGVGCSTDYVGLRLNVHLFNFTPYAIRFPAKFPGSREAALQGRAGAKFFTGPISVLGAQMKYERLCDGIHLPQPPCTGLRWTFQKQ